MSRLFNGSSYVQAIVHGNALGPVTGGFFSEVKPYTVMAWVNGAGTLTNVCYYAESNDLQNDPFLQCQANSGKARFFARKDGNGGTSELNGVATVATVFDNTWHHITYAQDGAGSPTTVRLYVDGALDSSATYTGGATSLTRSTIGALSRGTDSNFFAGKMAQVAVWERMLGPGEITALYQGQPILNTTPTHYWPLVQGTNPEVDVATMLRFDGRVFGASPLAANPSVNGDNPNRAQTFRPRLWQASYYASGA